MTRNSSARVCFGELCGEARKSELSDAYKVTDRRIFFSELVRTAWKNCRKRSPHAIVQAGGNRPQRLATFATENLTVKHGKRAGWRVAKVGDLRYVLPPLQRTQNALGCPVFPVSVRILVVGFAIHVVWMSDAEFAAPVVSKFAG